MVEKGAQVTAREAPPLATRLRRAIAIVTADAASRLSLVMGRGSGNEIDSPKLLRTVMNRRETGSLSVSAGARHGTIWFVDGSLHDAQMGKSRGQSAALRVLALRRGTYRLTRHSVIRPRTIHSEIESLLEQAATQSAELAAILDRLPPRDERLYVQWAALNDPQLALLPSTARLVESFAGGSTIDQVFGLRDSADLDTAKHTATLLRAGILAPARRDAATVLRAALLQLTRRNETGRRQPNRTGTLGSSKAVEAVAPVHSYADHWHVVDHTPEAAAAASDPIQAAAAASFAPVAGPRTGPQSPDPARGDPA